jgi:crotonobetainyl-CoA:carnitine CoA-transferase CaiB-like acyl-CoA transferase
MAQFDSATLEDRFRAHGAALGRVNEHDQVLSDPQVLHNQTVVTLVNGDAGRVRVARSAARFDGLAQSPTRGGARLGEHSVEVLQELGFDAAQIDQWLAAGAVRALR